LKLLAKSGLSADAIFCGTAVHRTPYHGDRESLRLDAPPSDLLQSCLPGKIHHRRPSNPGSDVQFVIVGPSADPAHIAGDEDVTDALRKIATQRQWTSLRIAPVYVCATMNPLTPSPVICQVTMQ
jgi:hypothetical protein